MLRNALILFLIVAIGLSCKLFQRNKYKHWEDSVYTDSVWQSLPFDPDYKGEEWAGKNEILYKNYKGSHKKDWDLVHTELSLHFDFAERSTSGIAKLVLHPHWTSLDSLILDARNMTFEKIVALDSPGTVTAAKQTQHELRWEYTDSAHLKIYLGKLFQRGQNVHLQITYAAFPYQKNSEGNQAISGDRGMYFINHDLTDPNKPRQIWTQGETESSCHWFPTLDAPNQKTTLRINLFVPDTMVTLSNGILLKNKPSGEAGIRLDQWEQRQPHAPYLTMVAIGNWSVISDQWRNKPVQYLVEKKYEPHARMIFGNTPKMIEFFSNYTGVDYPWDKYNQVVVRNFVSGAMENTSATVHMEGLQHTPSDHIDNTYEDYISHELFHQWFGDLVTTESWSNITLNESFATYGQYLWCEFYYGKASADEMLREFTDNYRFSNSDHLHLVRYSYGHDGELFDNVSYQKGACILHMLRYTVGEEAFREGLKRYLNAHKFGTAEVANLRMVFEEITGRDLNWFFNQWYFDGGQPKIQLGLEESGDGYSLRIEQTQGNRNCYAFPVKIKWSCENVVYEKTIFVDSRVKVFDFAGKTKPDWYIFDADNSLLHEASVLYADISEIPENIARIHRAFRTTESVETQTRLFYLAEKLYEETMGVDFAGFLDSVMASFTTTVLQSRGNFALQEALEFITNNSSVYSRSKENVVAKIQPIAENISFKSDTRVAAIRCMYYQNPNDSILLKFTTDTSPQVSRFAIRMLQEESVWSALAEQRIGSEKRSSVAISWAVKSMVNEKKSYSDVLILLAKNNNVDLESYHGAARDLLIYNPPGTERSKELGLLGSELKNTGKRAHLNMVVLVLKAEIESLEYLIGEDGSGENLPAGWNFEEKKKDLDACKEVLKSITEQ